MSASTACCSCWGSIGTSFDGLTSSAAERWAPGRRRSDRRGGWRRDEANGSPLPNRRPGQGRRRRRTPLEPRSTGAPVIDLPSWRPVRDAPRLITVGSVTTCGRSGSTSGSQTHGKQMRSVTNTSRCVANHRVGAGQRLSAGPLARARCSYCGRSGPPANRSQTLANRRCWSLTVTNARQQAHWVTER